MRAFSILSFVVFFSLFSISLNAAEYGTKEEAMAIIQKVKKLYKEKGKDAMLQAIINKKFNDRDLYPFSNNFKGDVLAHGAKKMLVGRNILNIKDQSGVYLIKEMTALVKGKGTGWVDYKWPDPVSKKIVDKSSYVEKLDDNSYIGIGIYKVNK